ncbi:hypothetical protein VTP01DRAFT_9562 [Rhizomucor pusillus]|uniref:uncharacterized protein n=1 Tax=Rhizomucor pusillus TaxID=4840 RepID=UPI003742DF09
MQDYYQQNVFGNGYSNVALQLSFVGTICLIFSNCMGPFAQILQSYIGTRGVLFIGTIFIALGLIIAGFAHEIWHLYLTQGLMFGVGVSFMYVTIMSVAPTYFTRKRGMALGIISSGSGIGGLIIPFIMTPINRSLGAGWTYRILGFICLACDLVATALVKERIPRKRKQHKKLSDIIKFEVLKDVNFGIWCAGAALQLMAYFQPFFFLPSYATWIGLSDSQGSSLVAVASAMNFLGRILCGLVADRIGPLNANIIFILMSALSTLLIWTFAFNYGTLMAYSVVFGLFCGSYFAQLSPITAAILGMERFPTGLSLVLLFNCIAVFGPNIASGIEGAVSSQPFLTYKMFTGVVFLAAAAVMILLRFRMNRKLFSKC